MIGCERSGTIGEPSGEAILCTLFTGCIVIAVAGMPGSTGKDLISCGAGDAARSVDLIVRVAAEPRCAIEPVGETDNDDM
jgi:hypothetical protein